MKEGFGRVAPGEPHRRFPIGEILKAIRDIPDPQPRREPMIELQAVHNRLGEVVGAIIVGVNWYDDIEDPRVQNLRDACDAGDL
jgi:hypothetical protein